MYTALYHNHTRYNWKKSLTAGGSLICEVEGFTSQPKKKRKKKEKKRTALLLLPEYQIILLERQRVQAKLMQKTTLIS